MLFRSGIDWNGLSKWGAPVGEVLGGIGAVGQVALGYGQLKQGQQSIDNSWEIAKMNAWNQGEILRDQIGRRQAAANAVGGTGYKSNMKLRNLDNV